MPTPGELGPRKGGLPRNLPPPEHNLVQNPTLSRAVARFSGVRQAHVMPALSEGMGVELTVGDVREDPRTGIPENFAGLIEIVPDNINVKRATFVNPITSDRIAVLRRLHVYMAEDYFAGGAGPIASLVYNLITPVGVVFAPLVSMQRTVTGYTAGPGGLAIPLAPPTGLTDIIFPQPQRSVMGWHSPPLTGIDGGYVWRGIIGGTAGPEIQENFNRDYGPRVIVYPGGCFQTYFIDNTAHAYFNMWWDEYKLT
jgi:hypothetical protein